MKMKKLLLFWGIWLFIVMGRHVAYAQQAASLLQITAAQSAYSKNIHSLIAKCQSENQAILSDSKESLTAGVTGAKKQKQSVFYAFKGVKHLEQRKNTSTDGSPLLDNGSFPSLMLYDGVHQHMITNMHIVSGKIVPEGEGQTRDTMTNMPERMYPNPLDFGYRTETNWISNVLTSGEFKVSGTEQSPEFGTLIRVQGQYKDEMQHEDQQITFWFAPKYGFISVRTEISKRDTKTAYQVGKLESKDGIWFATSANREMTFLGNNTLFARYSLTVSSIQVNTVADSLFEVKLMPGGQLYDQDGYVVYKIGPSGEKIVNHAFDEVLSGNRFSAWVGWLFVASLTSILLLGLGAFVKWRRRNASA